MTPVVRCVPIWSNHFRVGTRMTLDGATSETLLLICESDGSEQQRRVPSRGGFATGVSHFASILSLII